MNGDREHGRWKEFDAAEHYIARILQDDPMFSDASQQRSIVLIQRGERYWRVQRLAPSR